MLSCPLTENRLLGRRTAGALLLLFVFFLPFHFHPLNETSHISQECSCYLGGLPQLASAPFLGVLLFFVPYILSVRFTSAEAPATLRIDFDSARAPPLSFL